MNKAKALKQIFVTAKSEVGQFALITSILAEKKINLTSICAWQEKENACFVLITDDNANAILTLKSRGLLAQEEDVAGIILEDKIGAASEIAKKIKEAGIDLSSVYGTTCSCDNASALLILKSEDIAKLVETINS
ncbi:MAG: hypothetical protein ABIC68_07295 [Candidatus Omnitrophota bacterium]